MSASVKTARAVVWFRCPVCRKRRRNPTLYIDYERKIAHCGCART